MKALKIIFGITFTLNTLGCAHYFSSERKDQLQSKVNVELPFCIADKNDIVVGGDVSEAAKKFNSKFANKAMALIKKKQPNVKFDCESNESNIVFFTTEQKKVDTGFFFISLGIIPWIADTKYEMLISTSQKEPLFKQVDHGRVVMSVFFIPVFFLHKSEEEILSDIFLDYYEKQIKPGVAFSPATK